MSKKMSKKDPLALPVSATLEELCGCYLALLEREGAGLGTIQSYGMELKLALREFGKDTFVAALTPERVAAYFACDAVTKTRAGVLKAKPTVDKSRRVLRQALLCAQEIGVVAKAPIPEAPAKV